MSRRGDHIRKRNDGRWEGRYCRYDTAKKRKIYVSVYGKSYTQVKKKMENICAVGTESMVCQDIFCNERNNGQRYSDQFCESTTYAISDIAQMWLNEIANTLKYASYIKYKIIYEKHIREIVGMRDLMQIDKTVLEELIETYIKDCMCRGMPISESLRKSIYCVMNHILQHANKIYKTDFPQIKRIKRKIYNAKNVEIFNDTEQAKLIQYLMVNPEINKIGIYMCLSTGLRLGEICALKWDSINLKQKTLMVERTVKRIAIDGEDTKTILMETVPKTPNSVREIPLAQEIVNLLEEYNNHSEYLLCGEKPMEPRTYEKKLNSYLKTAGIKHHTFHALRHTFATNCISNGIDIKTVSELLGHSSVQITLDKYVHPSMSEKRICMEKISNRYRDYVSIG